MGILLNLLGGMSAPMAIVIFGLLGVVVMVGAKGKYPINVIIWEKRANGFLVKKAKAGRIKNKDSGVYEYKMQLPKFPFGEKKATKPQAYENIYMDDKGKPILFVYSDGKDQYVPCGIETFEGMLSTKIKVLDEDLCQFQVHSYRDSETKYKSKQDFWMKWGGVVTVAVTGVALMLVFYGAGQLYANIGSMNAESAGILNTLQGLLPKGGVAIPTGG